MKAWPGNVGLGWKWVAGSNTLGHFNTVMITAVKCFIAQARTGLPGAIIDNGVHETAFIPSFFEGETT